MRHSPKAEPMQLFLSDARGIYIPRDFAQSVARDRVAHVVLEDWAILEAGPEHEQYWDAWHDVLDFAVWTDDHGDTWRLHQDGDLWLVHTDAVYNETADTYEFPTENDAS